MNFEENDIDKLVQSIDQQQVFEFKDEYWNEFEQMLPSKKKRRFLAAYWLFPILTLGIVGFSVLYSGNKVQIDVASKFSKNRSERGNVPTSKKIITILKENKNHIGITKKKNQIEEISYSTNELKQVFSEPVSSHLVDDDVVLKNILDIKEKVIFTNEINSLETESLQLKSLKLFNFDSEVENFEGEIKNKKWSTYIDLFSSIGQSPIKNNSYGSNLTSGIGIGYGFTRSFKKMSINFGYNFRIQHYNNFCFTDRVKVYSFGVNNYEETVAYDVLYNLEMPLFVNYKNQKHSFSAGVVPSILLTTKLDYELNINGKTVDQARFYGYKKGLNNFLIQPSIKYSYSILPTIQLGAMLQCNVKPQITSKIFNGDVNNCPFNIQLSIRKIMY